MLECVPNFSEGRNPTTVRAIVDAIQSVPEVLILGWESDVDHNRSVVTFAGPPEAIVEGAVRGTGKAAELIDLNAHRGAHPRVGAADVVPFVPLAGSSMEDAVAAAHRAGEEIWRRFCVPVYFYEAAARTPDRKRLEKVRRAGFDGRPPDVGTTAAHPIAGAAVVGARGFLIAYNVDLETPDRALAQSIALELRESSGGFKHVKAMGVFLASRGQAQVSLNLTDFANIPLDDVFRAIEEAAKRLGTRVAGSELIGLVPRKAFEMAPQFFERARDFTTSRIIEDRIEQLLHSK